MNAESGEINFPRKEPTKLATQYQMVGPENIHK